MFEIALYPRQDPFIRIKGWRKNCVTFRVQSSWKVTFEQHIMPPQPTLKFTAAPAKLNYLALYLWDQCSFLRSAFKHRQPANCVLIAAYIHYPYVDLNGVTKTDYSALKSSTKMPFKIGCAPFGRLQKRLKLKPNDDSWVLDGSAEEFNVGMLAHFEKHPVLLEPPNGDVDTIRPRHYVARGKKTHGFSKYYCTVDLTESGNAPPLERFLHVKLKPHPYDLEYNGNILSIYYGFTEVTVDMAFGENSSMALVNRLGSKSTDGPMNFDASHTLSSGESDTDPDFIVKPIDRDRAIDIDAVTKEPIGRFENVASVEHLTVSVLAQRLYSTIALSSEGELPNVNDAKKEIIEIVLNKERLRYSDERYLPEDSFVMLVSQPLVIHSKLDECDD